MGTISLKEKTKTRYPDKKTMNLAIKEKDGNSLSKVLPTFVVLVVIVAVFSKFAVIDRINTVNDARKQYDSYQAELAELNTSLTDFSEIRKTHQHYAGNYLTEEEGALVDRLELLEILEDKMDGLAKLVSVSIVDNTVVIKVTSSSLGDIAHLRSGLESSSYVASVSVYTADTVNTEDTTDASDTEEQYVAASMVIEVANSEEDAE